MGTNIRIVTAAIILADLPLCAWAADIATSQPVIHFSDLKGVRSWRAGGDNVVYVKSISDEWYKAEMAETCMALDTKKGISFDTETDPVTHERVSKVVVDRHICRVTSLTKVDGPPAAKP
jgi:Family of unknown function (DUF6491)